MTAEQKAAAIAYIDALGIEACDNGLDILRKMRRNDYKPEVQAVGRVKMGQGSSKLCLLFCEFPFVVKWSNSSDFDEAVEEANIYKQAQAAGLERFFPHTEVLLIQDGITFVIQERVDCSVSNASDDDKLYRAIKRIISTVSDKIVQKMRRELDKASVDYRRSVDSWWLKMCISLYGKRACKALCAFAITHRINDLHDDNIGYKDGRPVILDFSGYHR